MFTAASVAILCAPALIMGKTAPTTIATRERVSNTSSVACLRATRAAVFLEFSRCCWRADANRSIDPSRPRGRQVWAYPVA